MTFFSKYKTIIFLLALFIIFFQGLIKLPVMDRDEARFATASKTMLKTGDFIDIKMLDEPRYKKPVGIYWLQSLSNKIFGQEPYENIFPYRVPSILSIFFSFFLIYRFVKDFYDRESAFFSIFFLALSFLSISEMHQAKTDGVLFLTITICNIYVMKLIALDNLRKKQKFFFLDFSLFWGSFKRAYNFYLRFATHFFLFIYFKKFLH